MRPKEIDDESNEHARALVRKIIQERFDGHQARASEGLGIAKSALNELLSGKRGMGLKMATQVANYLGVSVDEVTGRSSSKSPSTERMLSEVPGWIEAEARAARVVVRNWPWEGDGQAERDGTLRMRTGLKQAGFRESFADRNFFVAFLFANAYLHLTDAAINAAR